MTWAELSNVRRALTRLSVQKNPGSELDRYLQHAFQKKRHQLTRLGLL